VTLWHELVSGLGAVLRFLHDLVEPLPALGGQFAWGWAIVLLTVVVRVVLLPLAVKQINSMRAMQQLQPQIKKIQQKHQANRTLMRKDPEKFRAQRQKQQEEMMKLYREHNVNPAAGCLPLILQMPIFFALFTLLRDDTRIHELGQFGWYLIEHLSLSPTAEGNVGAYLLVVLMGATTYLSQKQMMDRNPASRDQPQMRIMLYAMPVMLTVFAFQFPVGVLLYWVTTNLWTMGQQWAMFRNIEPARPTR
jgi:YidC/Oxa1 family membrane protein insertase